MNILYRLYFKIFNSIVNTIRPNDIQNKQTHTKIKYDILDGIFKALFWHLIFIPIFILLYAFVLIDKVDNYLLLSWYAILFMSFVVPISIIYIRHKNPSKQFDLFLAEKYLAASSLVTSFIIGMSSWLFFNNLANNIAMFMVLSLSLGPAVSATAFAGSMRVWLGITVGLMVPVISYVYFHLEIAGLPGPVFALWLFLYSLYMFFIAFKQHKYIRENLILKHQLQLAIKTKSQYLAAASHDLRQPLHAMSYFVYSLKNKFKDEPTIIKLNQSLNCLNSLMDSLLDISKLDAQVTKVTIEAVSLKTCFTDIDNQFTSLAKQNDIKLNVKTCNQYVLTDKILLSRILSNLIENAIKYTQQGGKVSIKCYPKHEDIALEITDNGIGIEEKEMIKIFSAFYQIKSPQRNEGLGLGLAIVSKMAKLANIALAVKSTPQFGTTFTLTFIATNAPVISNKTQPLESNPTTQKTTIAIVDDQQDILDAVSEQLKNWGYSVLSAQSAQELLNQLKNTPLDLILCDYLLKDENGIETINTIRKFTDQYIPAIIITANTDDVELKKAKDLGYTILNKPVKPTVLRATIINYLHK